MDVLKMVRVGVGYERFLDVLMVEYETLNI